ncbi:hypothetical protein T10_7625 [Trichinella papuae]|uniref:Uncharacterized protein n=1 Tax=Trichinella papuae TaxID=268474 RepID=A0A0V1N847_9BILA|nr:hypothetical protein T10_13455 [Trichinella papuae]KRZ80308.1 hypothetical protein T10_7625 [Trichinella papuae]
MLQVMKFGNFIVMLAELSGYVLPEKFLSEKMRRFCCRQNLRRSYRIVNSFFYNHYSKDQDQPHSFRQIIQSAVLRVSNCPKQLSER